MITQKRLKELLDYDPKTGLFVWKVSRQCIRAGSIAGSLRKDGYIMITIDGKKRLAHVMAWLFSHGEYIRMIDHRDTNRSNNILSNLRPCTRTQNRHNSRKSKNNTTGYKNITLRTDRVDCPKPLRVYISGKFIGHYSTIEEAVEARNKALVKMRGEFANLNDS